MTLDGLVEDIHLDEVLRVLGRCGPLHVKDQAHVSRPADHLPQGTLT